MQHWHLKTQHHKYVLHVRSKCVRSYDSVQALHTSLCMQVCCPPDYPTLCMAKTAYFLPARLTPCMATQNITSQMFWNTMEERSLMNTRQSQMTTRKRQRPAPCILPLPCPSTSPPSQLQWLHQPACQSCPGSRKQAW